MNSLAHTVVVLFIGSTPQPKTEAPSLRGQAALQPRQAAPSRTRSDRPGQPPAPMSRDAPRIRVALHEPSSPFRSHLSGIACAEAYAASVASISRANAGAGTIRTLAFVSVSAPRATEPRPAVAVEPTTTRSGST